MTRSLTQSLLDNDDDYITLSLWSIGPVLTLMTSCLGMVEYSIILPSLALYVEQIGENHLFYGISVAAFSLGQLLSGPVYGVMADRRPLKEPLAFSLIMSIIGNIMYSLADPFKSPILIPVGRFVVGLAAGNTALVMIYIVRAIAPSYRTHALFVCNAINLTGILLGPVANALLSHYDPKSKYFNSYSNPGYCMASLSFVLVVAILVTFKEPNKDSSDRLSYRFYHRLSSQSDDAINVEFTNPEMRNLTCKDLAFVFRLLKDRVLWVHLVVNFASIFILAAMEAALPGLSKDFDFQSVENSFMYTGLGVCVLIVLAILARCADRAEDRTIMILGFIVEGAGVATALSLLLDSDESSLTGWCIVMFLLVGGSPLLSSPNVSLYAQRLEESEDTGSVMGVCLGLVSSVGGFARVAAPVWAGIALESTKNHLLVYIGPCIVLSVALLIFLRYFSYFHIRTLMH